MTVLEDSTGGRIYLRKALACSEPLAGQWGVGALDSYPWHMSEGLCPSIREWHLPLAAVNANLPDGPWEEEKQGQLPSWPCLAASKEQSVL